MGWGVGWQDRLRYRFDRLLARGSAATIIWVVGLAVFLALIGGVVFWSLDLEFDGQSGPAESFWQAFLIAIGSGEYSTTAGAPGSSPSPSSLQVCSSRVH